MTVKGRAATVEFRNVTKAYGPVVAVRDVSFSIAAGELVSFLGPSGCGKTTTLRLVAGLEMPSAGRILIGGEDVTRLPASERDVAMVFQSYALFPHMTVIENVGYGLTVSGVDKRQTLARARESLHLVGLDGFENRLPSELSGGQQQRVAVARALVLEPQVLLFDEPLSNLDAKLRRRMREEIRDLQRKLGLTTVYVTHDQSEALAVSDRIVVMRNATIAQVGTPHDLYERPVDAFVADFVGDANMVDADVIRIEGGEAVIRLGAVEIRRPHRGVAPGPARLSIRPEALRLCADPASAGMEGRIRKAVYLGSHLEYTVQCVLGELFAVDYDMDTLVEEGAVVGIRFAERGVNLVPGHPDSASLTPDHDAGPVKVAATG